MIDKNNKPFTVPRSWPDSSIICIAGGRSLTARQVVMASRFRKRGACRVIAVNDSYRVAPWADVHYFADGDSKWYGWHKDRPEFKAFPGRRFTIEAADRAPGVPWLKNYGQKGLSVIPDGVMTGGNSGHQAINLAVHLGATRIVLLGYDCRGDHWFGDHPKPAAVNFVGWIRNFQTLVEPLAAAGVTIVNASPGSAIDAFTQSSLEGIF